MSDSVRNYTGQVGSLKARRRRGDNRGLIRRIAFPLALILVIAFAWVTRDSYSVTQCMPGGQRICMVIADPMHARERVAASRVWRSIPAGEIKDTLSSALNQDQGIPDWILNNLFFERIYVSANDVHEFSDVLALSRMTRIGVLLERCHALVPGIEDDYAGGLRLRHVPDMGLFYAVRGRVLLFSPSREALIHALTLAKEQVVDGTTVADLTQAGTEDLRGTFALNPDDPFGEVFRSIAFAVRVDANAAQAKFRGRFRPESRDRFGPLFDGAAPVALAAPPEGMIQISADFGKPVRDVWSGLGQLFAIDWLSKSQWDAWNSPKAEGAPGAGRFLTSLVGYTGPGIRLSVVDVDVNEIVPMPVLAGTLDADAGQLAALAAVPAPPDDALPWDSYPRYDEGKGLAYIPMIGGPSLEPAAAALEGQLLLCTSRVTTEELLAAPPASTALPSVGNVYVRVLPVPLTEAIIECGRLLTAFDGLRGYDKETFELAASRWRASAAAIDDVMALASVRDGALEVELRIACTSPSGAE